MLLPEVKFETGQEVIKQFAVDDSIVKVIDCIEECIEKENLSFYNFMIAKANIVGERFKQDGEPELTIIAGRLGLCLIYDVVSKTCSSKKIPMPYITGETIDSFCHSLERDTRNKKQDSNVAFDFLKKLAVENLTIAEMLSYVANNSPSQLCAETTIVSGAITYFILGRQLQADLLETMLDE